MEVVVTVVAVRHAKLQSNPHHQQTNFLILSPNHHCQSTEGEKISLHGLAHPKLCWEGVFQLCLCPLKAPGYLGDGCHASNQPSDASTPKRVKLSSIFYVLL